MGDAEARERLFERCLPALWRWARGRLPAYARDLADTYDVVQDAALNTLNNLPRFQSEHPGALLGYLREAVANRIKDHIRRAKRRPVAVPLDDEVPEHGLSPLEHAVGQEQIALYEAALQRLSEIDRTAIVSRIELQYSYAEIASALGKPTANAARLTVVRAIERLVREMDRER
jgi:RNA polymerase sigma factor (sigma-70 family)